MAAPATNGGEALRRRIEELEDRELRAFRRGELVRANRLLRRRPQLKADLALIERPPR